MSSIVGDFGVRKPSTSRSTSAARWRGGRCCSAAANARPSDSRTRSARPARVRYLRALRAARRGRGRATSARPSGSAWVARASSEPPAVGACGRGAGSDSGWLRSDTARCEARRVPRSQRGRARPQAASPARCPRRPVATRECDSSADAALAGTARRAPGKPTRRPLGYGCGPAPAHECSPAMHVHQPLHTPDDTGHPRNGSVRFHQRRCLIEHTQTRIGGQIDASHNSQVSPPW